MPGILDAFLARLQEGISQSAPATILPGVNAGVQAGITPPPPPPPMDVGMARQQFVQNQGAGGMAPLPPGGIPSQPVDTQQGSGINWQMLMDIGIPALSALVGTAAPNTLAGAAGFSTGYTDTREDQRNKQFELNKEEKKRKIELENANSPTFAQKNKIAAIKTGLRSGKVVVGREFGEPQTYPSGQEKMNLENALLSIQDAGLDPALFETELTQYVQPYVDEYEALNGKKDKESKARFEYLRNLLLSIPFVHE